MAHFVTSLHETYATQRNGFRKKHSAYMPITHMHDEIFTNLKKKKRSNLYDILGSKNTFGTVCIEILIKKIHCIGVRG